MFPKNPLVELAIESLYDAQCTIQAYEKVTDPDTHQSSMKRAEAGTSYPCGVNVEDMPPVSQGGPAPGVMTQRITLFITKDVKILSGSLVTVTAADGNSTVYQCSGVPAVYLHHQEVELTLYEEHP